MLSTHLPTYETNLEYHELSINDLTKLNNQYLRYTEDILPYIQNNTTNLSLYASQPVPSSKIHEFIKTENSEVLHILAFNKFLSKRDTSRLLAYHFRNEDWGLIFIYLRNTKNIKIAHKLGILTPFLERFVNYLGLYIFTEEYHFISGPSLLEYQSFLSYLFKLPNLTQIELHFLEELLPRELMVVMLRTAFHALINNEISIKHSNIKYFLQNYSEELEDYTAVLKTKYKKFRSLQPTTKMNHQCNQVAIFHLGNHLNVKLSNNPSNSYSNFFPDYFIEYSTIPATVKQDPNILNELLYHNPSIGLELVKDTAFVESLSFSQLKILCAQTSFGASLGEIVALNGEINYSNKFDVLSALEHANELPSLLQPALLEELITHEVSEGIIFPLYPKILAKLNYHYLAQLDRMKSFQPKSSLQKAILDGIHKDLNFPKGLRALYFPLFLQSAQIQNYPFSDSSRVFKLNFEKYLNSLHLDLSDFINLSEGGNLTYAQNIEILTLL